MANVSFDVNENKGDLDVRTYQRKSFDVAAVQVTDDNLEQVAKWCEGDVVTVQTNNQSGSRRYISVPVYRPANQRMTEARVGDWVVCMPDRHPKVFVNHSFVRSFQLSDTGLEELFVTSERAEVTE